MNRYKAVIFDLDGTLLDTLGDIASTANEVLLARGFSAHEDEAYKTFIGDGVRMLMARALPKQESSDELIEACTEDFLIRYQSNWDKTSCAYEGIPELLDELVQRHYKISVLSNKPHDFTLKYVFRLLGRWNFDVVFGKREEVPKKPDPQGAIEITELMGCRPEECVYLGDTGVDMETATRAHMYPVGVLWGFREKEELEANGAKETITHPRQVLDLLV